MPPRTRHTSAQILLRCESPRLESSKPPSALEALWRLFGTFFVLPPRGFQTAATTRAASEGHKNQLQSAPRRLGSTPCHIFSLPLLRLLPLRSAHDFFLVRAVRRPLTLSNELSVAIQLPTTSSAGRCDIFARCRVRKWSRLPHRCCRAAAWLRESALVRAHTRRPGGPRDSVHQLYVPGGRAGKNNRRRQRLYVASAKFDAPQAELISVLKTLLKTIPKARPA